METYLNLKKKLIGSLRIKFILLLWEQENWRAFCEYGDESLSLVLLHVWHGDHVVGTSCQ